MRSLAKGRNQGACGARARNQNAITGPVPSLAWALYQLQDQRNRSFTLRRFELERTKLGWRYQTDYSGR
jgi:hypothetical protein